MSARRSHASTRVMRPSPGPERPPSGVVALNLQWRRGAVAGEDYCVPPRDPEERPNLTGPDHQPRLGAPTMKTSRLHPLDRDNDGIACEKA